jgi:Ni,Fe-hydrogenase III small subunit/NAD-dependent dihydropyrimidine dehydrogenase PreA subunit
MFREILTRIQQGHRTMAYPVASPPALPERFRGRPLIDSTRCPDGCRKCAEACPTEAIAIGPNGAGAGRAHVDLGKCLFCTECVEACPEGALKYSGDYRLSTRTREALVTSEGEELALAGALERRLLSLFGRSLKLRQVSAGGCNACEADVNVLGTVGWDLGRFGIQMVASPRHADGLLVTGCVSENMKLALQKTYDAVPPPKIVIAVGACAISGGPYLESPHQHGGAGSTVPVDLFIPGCPPHPLTILDGLLRLLGRIEAEGRVGGLS